MHCQVIAVTMEETLTKWLEVPRVQFHLTRWKKCRTVVPSSWVVSTDPTAQKQLYRSRLALPAPMDVVMLPMLQWGNNSVSIITKDKSIWLMNNPVTKRQIFDYYLGH